METEREKLLPQDEPKHHAHLAKGSHAHSRYGSLWNQDQIVNIGDFGDPNENTATGGEGPFQGPDNEAAKYVSIEGLQTSLKVVNLSYTVKERPGHWWNRSLFSEARDKLVLDNLSMTFNKGEITAIVGTSGSGKTSLLDVISGRAEGKVDGVVRYKHHLCTRDMMKERSSYVLQADRLLPTLTVRETLTYMALMTLGGSNTREEIGEKVQKVIVDMGLTHVSDSRVGGVVDRGVSGGEKRRITIGVQLLKDPEILLLDEPTSGLDSFTARHLVSTLVELAHKRGKLVLMTVHQPSTDIVNMLDKICILTGGQLAYLGPPSHMTSHFTNIGYPCPKNLNPCDVYIDITSVDRRNTNREQETFARANAICRAFEQSQQREDPMHKFVGHIESSYDDDDSWVTRDHTPSRFQVFQCLLERMNVHLWRNKKGTMNRMCQHAFFVPFLLLYIGRVSDDLTGGLQDRLGLLYQAVASSPYLALTNAIAFFPILRDTYYRESHDGMYPTSTFLAAYYVHTLPFNIISGTLFSSIFYWSAGFKDDIVVFGMFIIVIILMAQFGEMMAVAFMGLIRPAQLAADTTALLFNSMAFFGSGLIRSLATMPKALERMGFIAIHRYSAETVLANEFHELKFSCTDSPQPCISGDDWLDSHYPGARHHITRNFCVMGGYSLIILGVAIVMFKVRGVPTLH